MVDNHESIAPGDEARPDAIRRDDQEVREERLRASERDAGAPEIDDVPLGVPADEDGAEGDIELPGFPRDDPSHG